MSAERYSVYKHLKTMEDIEEAERTPFTYTNGRTETVMLRGNGRDDLKHDVERGLALIKDGAGGHLAAAAMAVEAAGRRGVKGLMNSGDMASSMRGTTVRRRAGARMDRGGSPWPHGHARW